MLIYQMMQKQLSVNPDLDLGLQMTPHALNQILLYIQLPDPVQGNLNFDQEICCKVDQDRSQNLVQDLNLDLLQYRQWVLIHLLKEVK